MTDGDRDDRDLSPKRTAGLLATEESIRLFVESVRDYSIIMLDPAGQIASWNEGARLIKGWTEAEAVGRHFSIFYPPEDVAAGKCEMELREAARAGRFEDLGWRVRKDGTRFFANVVFTALRDPSGTIRGFGKVTRDITERRIADEVLRRSEERFRLVVEGVKDYAIFMLDPRGHVASWNEGARRIQGYEPGEAIGRHFSAFYPRADVEAGKCEMELRVATGTGRFEDESWRVRKDGSTFWANVVITALHDKEGRLVGFGKVMRDLTERRRSEETRIELARAQAARVEAEKTARERAELIGKLEEAIRVRDDFLTIASHELKTPVYTLTMQLTSGLWLARREGVPEKLRTRLEGAEREVQRLTRLMNDLLDVSRLTAKRLTLEPSEHDLVALVKEIVDRSADEIARSGSTVTLDAPSRLDGYWDRLRLDQVITNLLANALKYGERRPIAIEVERAGEVTRVRVRDQGLGIDEGDQARIFERFERAVSTRSYSGFGLGLWIAREIVEAMGGAIRVQSAKGAGSTFTVELPNRIAASAA